MFLPYPFLLPVVIFCNVYAQKPEELLGKWWQNQPIEKKYLHLDRESYVAGETIWFKAYLSSDYLPDTISTNLYVELVNPELSVISKSTSPVLIVASNGQPGTARLASRLHYQAFTPYMFKTITRLYFQKIYCHIRKKNRRRILLLKPTGLVGVFPGGNLISEKQYGRI